MSEVSELREINDAQHKALLERINTVDASLLQRINSIGLINKILLTVIIALFSIILTVLLSINKYSEKAYKVRVETLSTMQTILDTTNNNIKWTHSIYNKEISKNTKRSIDNEKELKDHEIRIVKVEKKVGIR